MKAELTETRDIFNLLNVLNELKHLKRTGWVKFNIPEPETVACHMYRMAVLAMLLDNNDCDRAKCIRMTLVHDLGEAIIGDITPRCGISVTEKHRLEDEAMKKITEMVPSTVGEDWYSLWQEYEANETKEAKIVKHLDKFDMVVQASHYEQKYGIDLEEFFTTTKDSFTLEPFMSWNEELRMKRYIRKNATQENN
ncbi:HD domain containing protein [Brugia malayi]|uniref:5'-deoxynucleotidase HDDC2 n=2 Tax=Brugia TaxID=6278 RepID=A0A0K0JD92_BRUMA|nr:HD domain containing protein [Brugia malayi]CDP91900.1 Bm4114 [Brugia malayi]VIO88561.1 HD domain containing protein [Brugia malayi]